MHLMKKTAIAGALAATAIVGATAPAEAHVDSGVAVASGLLGLGVGAAIASDHPHYYGGGYYAPPPPPLVPAPVVYYAPPPAPAYAYDYVARCRVVDRWDGYYGRYVRTRRCW